MNFGELKTEVLFNTFDSTKYRERAGTQLNHGARDLASRVPWGYVEVTLDVVDGAASLGAPSGFSRIVQVSAVGADGVPSPLLSAGSSGAPGSPGAGSCSGYTTSMGAGGAIEVRPPAGVDRITVKGFRLPATMEADSDVCELGPDADDALVAFARASLSLKEDDPEMRQVWLEELAEARRRFSRVANPVVAPRLTPGTWGDGSFGGV